MQEPNRIVSVQGDASVSILKQKIERALANGDDAEALRLDDLLQQAELLINRTSEQGDPDDPHQSSTA
jgi:hypothetical protein